MTARMEVMSCVPRKARRAWVASLMEVDGGDGLLGGFAQVVLKTQAEADEYRTGRVFTLELRPES